MVGLDLADRRGRLSARQRQLLDERIRGSRSAFRPVLQRQSRTRCQISHAQERLWFLEQLGLVGSAYNMPYAVRMEGVLDVSALQRSFSEVVRRHEVLRTRFEMQDGQAVQIIDTPSPLVLERFDLSGLEESDRDSEVMRLAQEEMARHFELSQSPLLRAKLIRVRPLDHVVLVTLHHIVFDGWSIGILMRELAMLYEAYSQGHRSPLPELPIQYSDYAIWQRGLLQGEALEKQVGYWKERLRGAPAALDLPTDRVRPAVASFNGGAVEFELSRKLSSELAELGRREGATLYMVLLAAYQLLLKRYSGQDDIVVGSPIAGRSRPELEGLIGFFVNSLAMRTDLSGDPPFAELVRRVKVVALGAYAHQDLPFEKLVEELRPARDLSRQPVFQVGFTMDNAPRDWLPWPGLQLTRIGREKPTAKYDLVLDVLEREEHLEGYFEYASDLFEKSTIERLTEHWKRLLEAVVARPDVPVSDLSILGPEERAARQVKAPDLASLGSDQAVRIARAPSLTDCFLAQIRSRPEAVALVGPAEHWSYVELGREAGRIAALLLDERGDASEPIGLLFPHAPRMVAAILGVLGAGKFYVPLSTYDPPGRLRTILTESRCGCVLVAPELRDLADQLGAVILSVDQLPIDPIELRSRSPGSIAYVLYTSGTTGTPKGVVQCDRNVLQHIAAYSGAIGLCASDRMTLLAGYGTDTAVENIFGSLLNGMALCLWDVRGQGIAGLENWLVDNAVTIWHSTPSLLRAAMAEFAAKANLRWVVLGGEAAKVGDIGTVRRHAGESCRLLTGLSQTECTTGSFYAPDFERDLLRDRIAVGRPVPGVQIVLLDGDGRPTDVRGEVAMGGNGIALGYWQRPDLTADRFVPSPFAEGGRLYRTGDLARWRGDGELEHLGRIDHQVKVRGYRIELSEIEAKLLEYGDVDQAVVVARADEPSEPRLVAYVVGSRGATVDAGGLRWRLKQVLPEYMVPSAFVVLDALPLTPNRKVDRRALPAPEAAAVVRGAYAAPRSPAEQVLVSIWREVLKVERIGIDDNFFELGGHSLLATRMIARARDGLSVELPLRTLFQAPTIRGVAEWIETEQRSGGGVVLPPLQVHTRPDRLLLSHAQERLWFLEQLGLVGSAYNIPLAVRLEGALDVSALRRSLDDVVRRHEALRTRFEMEDGQGVQVIDTAGRCELEQVDVSGLEERAREAEIRRLAQQEASHRFDLSRGPLLRAQLIRAAALDHVVLVTMHHIISDGWSIGVLISELAALYEAYSQGRPSPLAELPIQYADYAIWQRGWLQGEVLERQVGYWKERLQGAPAALDLPTDRVRPAVASFDGGAVSFALSPELSRKLVELGRREGVTLYMVLLAAYQLLLKRYSGQDDIVVGSPIAGRSRWELEGLIGFFVNTLAMRTDLSGDPSFRELLKRVKEVALGAYAHQDLPFEKLVEELQPVRDLSRQPVFQVSFALQNTPQAAIELSTLTLRPAGGERRTSLFDLALLIRENEAGLLGTLEYAADLFDRTTIERWAGHFKVLLEGIVADPAARLSELPLLGQAERHKLIEEWNATAAAYPHDKGLHELFAEQAARTPDAVALVYEDERLSYAELDRRSNQLAHHLRELGVGPEVVVGICVERSLEMLVGLLGILKAGGAYLPLDPSYPAERLAYMLSDAKATVLVTQARLINQLPPHDARVLRIDADWPEIGRHAASAPINATRPRNLAYVIYTSGSTGKPKGVMVTHGSVVNFLGSMAATPGIDPTDVLAAVTPISFDIAGLEVYLPLVKGARAVIVPRQVGVDGVQLRGALDAAGVTMLQATPSTWRLLVEAGWRPTGSLKILCGGEAMPADLARRLAEHGSSAWNLYGPTETTIWSTLSRLHADQTVRIGRPISNTQLYVLDATGAVVPTGVAGELHIGGAGLARGYCGRPDLTAERFVPHPFGDGERLYRTGDLVRYLANGDLEFLGRIDHQVKIRGYRIELGEIESALLAHDAVAQAVVTVRDDGPGDKRLVAYVVGSGQAVSAHELRADLQRRLPEYMVPSAFMVLDVLPLTPNRKVDRRALPAPEATAVVRGAYAAPRSPAEQVLESIWREVLKVDRIGIDDNFFDLGGHSLLATRMIARARDGLSVELPLRTLFQAPTIRGVAERIETEQRSGGGVVLPPLQVHARPDRLLLSHAQERLWFLEQLGLVGSAYNIPLAVRLEGALDVSALRRSLGDVVRRHEALRTRFEMEDGQGVQVIDAPGTFELEQADVSGLEESAREAEIRRLAQQEASRRFDLSRGPLLRAKLIRAGALDHVVLVTMHHIISDGWSIGVLISELAALYEAYSQGRPSPLAELPIQYADYAIWQHGWLQGEVLERQVGYWKERLQGAPAALDLPTDRVRPAVTSFDGGAVPFALSPELSRKLTELGRREGVTLYMVLLAAYQLLLKRYSGQDDIVVGSPIAGRSRWELEGLIGFFVNTLAMRTDLSGDPSFRELLKRVKEVALGAYAHQDLPFEKLVEELQPVRDLSRQPVFQASFALQNTPQAAIELSTLTLRPAGGERRTSLFDLALLIREGESGLLGTLQYAADLFDRTTIERWAGHFEVLLEGIVADPAARLSELPLLGQAERHKLIEEWNATAAAFPHDKGLHELFAEQAARTPDAVALVYEDERLSYAELDRRSNQLAHHLRELGVGPEVVVGICVERSLEMLVGLLGILKAGGAYLPLDPSYPAERLAYMVSDAKAPVVVTQQHLVQQLPAHDGHIVQIDADWAQIARQPDNAPINATRPGNLAYVIYTSGSTGQPKGAANTHAGIVNRLAWMQRAYQLGTEDRVLQKTPFSFDVSVWELFWPLMAGVPLVVARPNGHQDPSYLASLIERQSVTIAHFVPSMLHAFLDIEDIGRCRSLRAVMCSGEALSSELTDRFLSRCQSRLHNLYGPTEAAIDVSAFECGLSSGTTSVPIGRPISNIQLYVLDQAGDLVPIGVTGELYIGGAGLARGYFGRPDLTAERFVPHPFGDGERLYRTGDLVRQLADGNIEFLGRLDHQVKIRGFRIELGEIEARLLEHVGVREAVVVAREASPGDQRLIAYVVGSGEAASSGELRAHLQRLLPSYMVPSAFVALQALPLTPNGKLDRRALPAPTGRAVVDDDTAPRTAIEEILVHLWQDLLAQQHIGIHDSFFELGGHSLLAMRLIAQVRNALGVDLSLRFLFEEHPTIASMAAHIIATRAAAQGYEVHKPTSRDYSCIIPIQLAADDKRILCIHPIGGGILCYQELAKSLGQQYSVYGIKAVGLHGEKDPLVSIGQMADHHIARIFEMQRTGPFHLVGWSAGGLIALAIATKLKKLGHSVGLLALIDTLPPSSGGEWRHNRRQVERTEWLTFMKVLDMPVDRKLSSRWNTFWRLRDDEKMQYVLGLAKRHHCLPKGMSEPEFMRLVAVFQANLRALQQYVVDPYDGKILLFQARDALQRDRRRCKRTAEFWSSTAQRGCNVHYVDGDHGSMIISPAVDVISDQLRREFNNWPAASQPELPEGAIG